MQRLHNIGKWFVVDDGKAVNFGNPEPRLVRLDVNAPEPVRLHIVNGDGEYTFLARVVGRDVIEFRSEGEFSIVPDGGSVSLYTIDGEDISFSIPDAVKITKLIDRRPRDPALELMQYQMRKNVDDRMQAIRDEMERELHRRLEAAVTATAQPKAASASGAVSAESKPAESSAGGEPDKPVDAGTASEK